MGKIKIIFMRMKMIMLSERYGVGKISNFLVAKLSKCCPYNDNLTDYKFFKTDWKA